MSEHKLKIKIGNHEFEAEGTAEAVQSQFEIFKELIASAPATTNKSTPPPDAGFQAANQAANAPSKPALEKIMQSDGRVVSLTAHPADLDDSILAVLLGQRHFRQNDSVTGGEIIDGLRQSGTTVSRIDNNLVRLASDGQVIKVGTGRASRYRLTNKGVAKAEEIASELISQVP